MIDWSSVGVRSFTRLVHSSLPLTGQNTAWPSCALTQERRGIPPIQHAVFGRLLIAESDVAHDAQSWLKPPKQSVGPEVCALHLRKRHHAAARASPLPHHSPSSRPAQSMVLASDPHHDLARTLSVSFSDTLVPPSLAQTALVTVSISVAREDLLLQHDAVDARFEKGEDGCCFAL